MRMFFKRHNWRRKSSGVEKGGRTWSRPTPTGDVPRNPPPPPPPARVTPVATTSLTDDRTDPGLRQIDSDTNMQKTYLVLSDEERAKGYVRPVRISYVHEKCGGVTRMGRALAETYARQPDFYGGTYCAVCKDHFPVGPEGEFVWDGTTEKVGT